jgi:uncharacterized protein YlaN (UPF0358 family)
MKTIIKTLFYVVSACALSMPFSLSAKKVFESKMEAVSNQLKAAVKSGKLSEEDAWAKWKAIQGGHKESKKGWNMEAISKKLKAAVAAGKISESEARQKLKAIKDESDHLKDSGHDDEEINEEEELWQEVGRGLKAAIELGKIDEEEAKEIWEDLKTDDFEDEHEGDEGFHGDEEIRELHFDLERRNLEFELERMENEQDRERKLWEHELQRMEHDFERERMEWALERMAWERERDHLHRQWDNQRRHHDHPHQDRN